MNSNASKKYGSKAGIKKYRIGMTLMSEISSYYAGDRSLLYIHYNNFRMNTRLSKL
jgi:hypothetical protein